MTKKTFITFCYFKLWIVCNAREKQIIYSIHDEQNSLCYFYPTSFVRNLKNKIKINQFE